MSPFSFHGCWKPLAERPLSQPQRKIDRQHRGGLSSLAGNNPWDRQQPPQEVDLKERGPTLASMGFEAHRQWNI